MIQTPNCKTTYHRRLSPPCFYHYEFPKARWLRVSTLNDHSVVIRLSVQPSDINDGGQAGLNGDTVSGHAGGKLRLPGGKSLLPKHSLWSFLPN